MAEPNTRIVVTGTLAVEKRFAAMQKAKRKAEQEAKKLQRELDRAERKLRREVGR